MSRNLEAMLLTSALIASGVACSDSEAPECNPIAGSIMEFAHNQPDPENIYDSSYQEIGRFVSSRMDLSPQELVDQYIETWSAENTSNGLDFTFDPGLIPDTWEPQNEALMESGQQQVLVGKIDTVLRTLNEYPKELFAAIGVTSVHMRDIYNNYGGHFSDSTDEISIEFDSFTNDADSVAALRQVVAHEVFGHAGHSAYCQENLGADSAISDKNGDFEYIGYPDDDLSREERIEFYDQVPQNLWRYGPDRMFARPYGATSVAEDVATIVDFTLEHRGLIRRGDADYGSPLYEKQQEVIDRMDFMLPGFRVFAELRTDLLRSNPLNEVNVAKEQTLVIPPELTPDARTYDGATQYESEFADTDTVAILNGAMYEPHGKARGGILRYNPIVRINPEGKIVLVYHQALGTGSTSYAPQPNEPLRFYASDELGQMPIATMTYAEWKTLTDIPRDWNVTPTQPNSFLATNPQPYIYKP